MVQTENGSPNRYLPGERWVEHRARPEHQYPELLGLNMWPQSAQKPFYNINAFAYPAQFTGYSFSNWYGSNGTLQGVLRIAF
jgi:hypothetical protein